MISQKNERPLPELRSKVFWSEEKSCKSPSVGLELAIPGLVAGRSTYVATESLDTNNDPKTSIYVH